ncbi:transposable element Tcb2 transposase [Trichonephila clavipes]|nr:transposable element Tcb2 transposase [Trichonephila clavipes]
MTGHIYRDVILEQHVRLFRGAMGAEFLFMDDNAHSHRANIVDECLQSEDITPRQPPPTCLPELRRALLDEWCNIPQEQIDNLMLSMSRRWILKSEAFVRSTKSIREFLLGQMSHSHVVRMDEDGTSKKVFNAQ